jgi:hypothetical protein
MKKIYLFTLMSFYAEASKVTTTPSPTPVATLAGFSSAKKPLNTPLLTGEEDVKKFLTEKEFYSRSNVTYLLSEQKIINNSEVSSYKEGKNPKQKMKVNVAGLHQKNCEESSKILSQYEDYKKNIPFIEESDYKNGKVYLTLQADPIPTKFGMDLQVDRLTGPGVYPYLMGKGIFEHMTGEIYFIPYKKTASEKKEQCLIFANADWDGKDTGYADFLVQTFTQTIAKKGLENLFKMSGSKPNEGFL